MTQKEYQGYVISRPLFLRKIENADAVVADLTFISKSTQSDRYCSNPNVLFELGFAFHAVGWERLILVMNEQYGPRTEQMFDLNHRRFPISYAANEDTENIERIKGELSNELAIALKGILELGIRQNDNATNDRNEEEFRLVNKLAR